MKKFIISLCILSASLPAIAKPNYSYSMPQTIYPTTPIITQADVTGDNMYSVKVQRNETPTQQTKIKKNKNKEKITQVDSIVYYDSGVENKITGRQIGAAAGLALVCALDPYIVTIDGKEYILIIDKNNIFEKEDILGIYDTPRTLFQAMLDLESDGDPSYISGEELKKAGVRFVRKKNNKVYFNDTTQDFDIERVKGIPLNSMVQILPNYYTYGTFGTFDIYTTLKNGHKIIVQNIGKVDFVKEKTINKWINGNN